MWITLTLIVIISMIKNSESFISAQQLQKTTRKTPVILLMKSSPTNKQEKTLSVLSKISLVSTSFFIALQPTIALADPKALSVFEDEKLLRQVGLGLGAIAFSIIPYFVFNLIIAPKLGLVVEDKAGEDRNNNRDYF